MELSRELHVADGHFQASQGPVPDYLVRGDGIQEDLRSSRVLLFGGTSASFEGVGILFNWACPRVAFVWKPQTRHDPQYKDRTATIMLSDGRGPSNRVCSTYPDLPNM